MVANGMTYSTKKTSSGIIATVSTDRPLARLSMDALGATCSCDWPVAEGKCVHLLLMEQMEGKQLAGEWPTGRHGKLWPWQ